MIVRSLLETIHVSIAFMQNRKRTALHPSND